jgi:CRP-like cAMP-binding protein
MRKILSQAQLFKGLSDSELDRLVGFCALKECPRGTQLIRAGGQLDYLYVIREGKADVSVNGRTVATLEQNALLGEMSFVDNSPPTADVVMTSDCKLLQIEMAGLNRLMESDPRLGFIVMRNVARILSLKLSAMNEKK